MKASMRIVATCLAFVLLGAVGAGGYWLGTRSTSMARDGVVVVAPAASAPAQRKVLYYRNPMGLADTSPTPKKDPMGMDYVPVYEGEDASKDPASPNQIRIGTEKIQKLGVRVEAASMRQLGRSVRAAGRVEPDERRIGVGGSERIGDLLLGCARFQGAVDRFEDSTIERYEMRHKGDARPQLLLDLRRVPVLKHGIRRHAAVVLRKVRALGRCFARA